jgi:hypothetical protein
LNPTAVIVKSDCSVLPFRYDAFAVTLANLLKEFGTTGLNVFCEQDALWPVRTKQTLQTILPFEQGQASQVPSVDPKQIESVEDRLTSTVQHIPENAPARCVEVNDLTIEHGILDAQFSQWVFQWRETLVGISAAWDQLAGSIRNVCETSKTIVFEFADPISVIERFSQAGERHRGDLGRIFI